MGETYNADMLEALIIVFNILIGQVWAVVVNHLAVALPIAQDKGIDQDGQREGLRLRGYENKPRAIILHLVFLIAAFFGGQIDLGAWDGADAWVIFAFFVLVSVIDIERRLILNQVVLFGALFLGIRGFEQHGLVGTIFGGLAGFVIFYALFLLAQWLAKWMRARRGEELSEVPFGGGDVNLAGVIGLLLGWPGVIAGLFLGLVLAGVYSAGLIVLRWAWGRYEAFDTIPLGPFLGAGAMLAIILSAAV